MVFKEGREGVHVVDTWEDLLKVTQSELLFLKLNNNIDILFSELIAAVGVFVQLLHYFLKIGFRYQVKRVLSFLWTVQS